MGGNQSASVAGFRTDRAEHIQIIVLSLSNCPRTAADARPDASERAVLAKAGLILVIAQDAFVWMSGLESGKSFGQVFF
jgi:hypothetical protein